MTNAERLLAIVKAGDAPEIESARDRVTVQDLDALLAAYWTLTNWDDKACLMQLFSDHLAPQGRAVMLDFLKAPTDDPLSSEYNYSGKVVALCQLEGSFKNSEAYWYDRALLDATAQKYLASGA